MVQLLGLDRCFGCRNRIGARSFHMEHTVPVFAGGGNTWTEVHAVCAGCHNLKDDVDGSRRLGDEAEIARLARLLGYTAVSEEGLPVLFG